MAYGVLIQSKVAAQTLDSLNRAAVGTVAIENGSVFSLATRNTAATSGQDEVWDATVPATGAGLTNLWMAYEPEVVTIVSGSLKFKGLTNDPRLFRNEIGDIFTAFKPQLGDILRMSVDAVAGTKSSNGFVVATNAAYKLTWAASAVSGLTLKLIATTYISIGSGAIDTQRVVSYDFEVVALA